MGSPRPIRADCGRSNGFALIIVLWTLVLIAFIFAQLTASGRTEIRIAGNLVANAQADAALDGAVFQTIFNLSDASPERRWPLDGTARELAVGDSRVTVRIEDEAARINPNLASPTLLEALLRAAGSDRESAPLVAAIREWIGAPMAVRPKDAVSANYRAAGLDYEPPGAPLETIDELGRVLGMTPAVLAAIRPHLSLFGPAEPDAAHADPVVAAILAAVAPSTPVTASGRNPQLAPDVVTARITADAYGPGNARVRHVAVVRVGEMRPGGSAILAWDSGLD